MFNAAQASVDQQNEIEYAKLVGDERTYKSRDWGSPDHSDVLAALQRDCQAAETIKLRVGTQVMLLKNLAVEERLFNGARGTHHSGRVVSNYILIRRGRWVCTGEDSGGRQGARHRSKPARRGMGSWWEVHSNVCGL